MTRRLLPMLAAAVLALQLAGCGAGGTDNSDAAVAAPNAEAAFTTSPTGFQAVPGAESSPSGGDTASEGSDSSDPAASASSEETTLLNAAHEVVGALRDRDLERLAEWIDPVNGVRFSPYANINEKNDIVWRPDELPTFKDTRTFVWGVSDGKGDPIELSFRDYFERFVYDQDFADAPDVTANKLLGTGNVAFNGKDVYPDASFVEFHFPGFDSKVNGMDWESLILVFTPSGSDWQLRSIVHSQWTI